MLFKKKRKDLTKGSISENLIWLAYPVMLAMFLNTSYNIVDTIFVGRINHESIAAVSMVFPIDLIIISLGSGIGVGITSLIARYLGANQRVKADDIANNSITLGLIISIVATLLSFIFAKPIFKAMGADEILLPIILDYFYIIASGFIFVVFTMIFSSILRGEGDTRTPTKALLYSNALNIVLTPLFIFYFGLGVRGAALTTVISRFLACSLLLLHLLKNKSIITINFKRLVLNNSIIRNISKVGIPSSLTFIVFALSIFFINKILVGFNVAALAAYGLGFRFDLLAIMPAFGIASAVVTIAGHNIGAGKLHRVRKTVFVGSILAGGLMGVIGLILFSRPEFWVFLFNKNLDVLQYGVSYLNVVTLSYVALAPIMVISAAFQGAGEGKPPLIISIFRLFVLTVPLSYILSDIYGVPGIWYAITIANVASGILAVFWFKADKRFKSLS